MSNTLLIYLLGAGRSGTTLLATILNHHPEITTLGEMHQFSEHVLKNKKCSCGLALDECSFWSDIIPKIDFEGTDFSAIEKEYNSLERHYRIPKFFFQKNPHIKYLERSHKIFDAIFEIINTQYVLDSSKYIARFLLLNRSNKYPVKGIYMVRDVRGVIHSFNKKVQTSRSALSALLYYNLINFWGELVYRLYPNVIKVKYEDLITDPESTIQNIYDFLFENEQIPDNPDEFLMPHIIGGNRLKNKQKIKLNKEQAWIKESSFFKKCAHYLLAWPFMLINKYKI